MRWMDTKSMRLRTKRRRAPRAIGLIDERSVPSDGWRISFLFRFFLGRRWVERLMFCFPPCTACHGIARANRTKPISLSSAHRSTIIDHLPGKKDRTIRASACRYLDLDWNPRRSLEVSERVIARRQNKSKSAICDQQVQTAGNAMVPVPEEMAIWKRKRKLASSLLEQIRA